MAAIRENSQIVKGSSLMLFYGGATGASYQAIGFATSHSFNKTLNVNEVSTKDHGDWNANIGSTISWEITTENLYSTCAQGWDLINEAFNSKKEVYVAFGLADGYEESVTETEDGIVGVDGASNWGPTNSGVEYGKALITSLQLTASSGDNATFTATFTGSGKLSTSAPA